MNYYNEIDPFAAEWLRNLIREGLIPPGDVDERDIREVQPDEIRGYTQCHFFAGIAGWSLALQLAGWPANVPVWTGSCPCQPFSAAGKRKGTADERHLWPEFYRLIRECRPPVVFGEQVASKDGLAWLDGVCADLENEDYAVGAADLCAAGVGEKGAYQEFADALRCAVRAGHPAVLGREQFALAAADYLDSIIVGAPHIRQRLWWVAEPAGAGREGSAGRRFQQQQPSESGDRLAESDSRGLQVRWPSRCRAMGNGVEAGRVAANINPASTKSGGSIGELGHSDNAGLEGRGQHIGEHTRQRIAGQAGDHNPWSDYILVPCRDGKARRIKPGIAPLVNGAPARVGRLRAYGNAICPQVAAEFIKAYREIVT